MKRYRMMGLVLALSFVCLAGAAQADPVNLVANGDFTTDIVGWNATAGTGSWNSGTDGSPDGPSAELGGPSWFLNRPTTSLVAGQTYKVSFLAVLLTDDGNTVDETLFAAVGDDTTIYASFTPKLTSTWTRYSYEVSVPAGLAGGTYNVAFLNSLANWAGQTGGAGSQCKYGLDSVSLTAIPEPATVGMTITGILGLLAYAWRKRK